MRAACERGGAGVHAHGGGGGGACFHHPMNQGLRAGGEGWGRRLEAGGWRPADEASRIQANWSTVVA